MRLYSLLLSLSLTAGASALDMNHLYVVGPAATAGEWTAELPEEMVSIGYGIFIWEGYLGAGEFKFINKVGDWNSSVVSAEHNVNVQSNNTYTVYDNSGNQHYDFKFINPQAGECRIIVNLASNPMTMKFRRPSLLMVGSAARGWGSPDLNIPVYADDEGKVEWTGLLSTGELKFLTSANWSPCYNARYEDNPMIDGGHELIYHADGTDDHKFKVLHSRKYTLQFDLNINTMKVTSHPGPSFGGGITAAVPGRYVVAVDRNSRGLFFGAVPEELYVKSLDGAVTRLSAIGSNSRIFKGELDMSASNYYKLYADEACSEEYCFSPNADVDISQKASTNVAPMSGYSYRVSRDGFYEVTADFSQSVPSVYAKYVTTGVEGIEDVEKAKVRVDGRDIIVEGDVEQVAVYDIAGRLISTQSVTENVAPGIYVVVADLQTIKLTVK